MTRRSSWNLRVYGRYLLIVFALSVGMVGYVWKQGAARGQARRFRQLSAHRRSLEQERAALEARITELRASSRILKVAQDSLGMVPPVGQPLRLSVQAIRR